MKKSLLTLFAFGFAAMVHGADLSTTATVAAVSPVASPAAAVTPAPAPTAKPLYVDYQPPDWAKGWEHISLKQAEKYHTNSKYLFCDARAKAEFDQGHIPGAIPLPTGEFDKYYNMYEGRIKSAKKLITYCHGIGCRLSEKSAQSLVGHGHKNVAVFFGGWPQWNEAKLPVETGESRVPKSEPKPTALPVTTTAATASTVTAATAMTGSAMAVAVTPSAAAVAMTPAAEAKPVSPAAKTK